MGSDEKLCKVKNVQFEPLSHNPAYLLIKCRVRKSYVDTVTPQNTHGPCLSVRYVGHADHQRALLDDFSVLFGWFYGRRAVVHRRIARRVD